MFDCDFAVVCDGGPDADGLAWDVAAPVQPHPACHGTRRHAGKSDFVLDLTMEGLLERKKRAIKIKYS